MPNAVDRAQVIIARVPARDWPGFLEWAQTDPSRSVEFRRHGTYTLAIRAFEHSTIQPLVALLIPEGSKRVAMIAAAYRGRYPAAAGLSQLEVRHAVPIPSGSSHFVLARLRTCVLASKPALRRYFTEEMLTLGGLLSPSLSTELQKNLWEGHAELRELLVLAFIQELESLPDTNEQRRFVFQQQSDAARLAFAIARVNPDENLRLAGPIDIQRSFLQQLEPSPRLSEEQVLRWDAARFPGMAALAQFRPDVRTFESGRRRLDLIFAHREPLEKLTGADFIYYTTTFRAYVLVQYKLLETIENREIYRINDHMRQQIQQMRQYVPAPATPAQHADPLNFRLGHEACYWKFVSRHADLEGDQNLIPGHYLPLGLLETSVTTGVRDGQLIVPEELPRKLSNTDFATLVRDAWIGTAADASHSLESLIGQTLEGHRGLTVAIA
jgi:hypothetical protein